VDFLAGFVDIGTGVEDSDNNFEEEEEAEEARRACVLVVLLLVLVLVLVLVLWMEMMLLDEMEFVTAHRGEGKRRFWACDIANTVFVRVSSSQLVYLHLHLVVLKGRDAGENAVLSVNTKSNEQFVIFERVAIVLDVTHGKQYCRFLHHAFGRSRVDVG